MNARIDRRAFAETLLMLPVGLFLLRCGSSSGSSSPGGAPQVSGTEDVYTSSVNSAHDHTFGIDVTDFTSPPAAGVSGTTSTDDDHNHTVTVSMAELQSVTAGQSVEVTTSTSAGHTHVFTFVKVA